MSSQPTTFRCVSCGATRSDLDVITYRRAKANAAGVSETHHACRDSAECMIAALRWTRGEEPPPPAPFPLPEKVVASQRVVTVDDAVRFFTEYLRRANAQLDVREHLQLRIDEDGIREVFLTWLAHHAAERG